MIHFFIISVELCKTKLGRINLLTKMADEEVMEVATGGEEGTILEALQGKFNLHHIIYLA